MDCINRCENASEGASRLVDQVEKFKYIWILIDRLVNLIDI